jgi:hypothetical protein
VPPASMVRPGEGTLRARSLGARPARHEARRRWQVAGVDRAGGRQQLVLRRVREEGSNPSCVTLVHMWRRHATAPYKSALYTWFHV